jgi:hypothetical protein
MYTSPSEKMSWECGTCGVILSLSTKSGHLRSSAHQKRLNGRTTHICELCKVSVRLSNIARHKTSHIHIAALAMAESNRQANITQQNAIVTEVASSATMVTEERKAAYSSLDKFIIARYRAIHSMGSRESKGCPTI